MVSKTNKPKSPAEIEASIPTAKEMRETTSSAEQKTQEELCEKLTKYYTSKIKQAAKHGEYVVHLDSLSFSRYYRAWDSKAVRCAFDLFLDKLVQKGFTVWRDTPAHTYDAVTAIVNWQSWDRGEEKLWLLQMQK